ncbi:MAG: HNH endonuclease [Oleispira antarctica]|nr:HNH endonuclease [Oleispira antarctica]
MKHWADGGDTKLDNLVTLCRHHHRELHKGSFFLSPSQRPYK